MKDVKIKILAAREKINEKLNHASLEMETSTHFPMLIKAVQSTDGPILEMGSGLFSTPLLHWLCFADKRPLVTIENYKHYLEFANKFATDWHQVKFLEPKLPPPIGEHYSVVFIDHSPKQPRTRGDDALLFKDHADYIVLHDAGADSNPKYGYDKIYPYFKYRHDWTGCFPHTTVLSNFKPLLNEWT